MKRRKFIRNSSLTAIASVTVIQDLFANSNRVNKENIYGHNGMQYTLDTKWSKANPLKNPVNDCHEMVQDEKGRILLLTNETKNNVLIFDSSGKLLETWGDSFPGAHGLTHHKDHLFITDTEKHQVFKTSMSGKILLTIDPPEDLYPDASTFVPTEVAVLDNEDFYIADGYGQQYILHYDKNGKLLTFFGGRGDSDEKLDNAHGICVDDRTDIPTLLVTDRTRTCFKRFSFEGVLIEVINLPGACVCRPVVKGDYLYAAVLRSPDLNHVGTGFVTILDRKNKVISNIGGTAPQYSEEGKLQHMAQQEKIFIHPHDICVDQDENLYVAQWSSGKVYPYKLNRV